MDLTTVLFLAGLALLIGLAISYPSIMKIIRIRRTPTTWISALPSAGRVEVAGKVGEKTILSPINNTACAAYKVEVQELKKTNNGAHWSTIHKSLSEEPFELNDDTGSLQVYPAGADLILSMDSQRDQLTADQVAAIQNMGIKTTGFFGSNKKLKVNEYLIRPQQEIYVMGQLQQNGGQKSITSGGDSPFVISDRSERDVLFTLYKRVGLIFLITVGIAAAIVITLVIQ